MLTKNVAYLLFLCSFLLVFLLTGSVNAAQTSSGNIEVKGFVAGSPPSTPPTIEQPASNTNSSTKSITVKGSCIADLVVKIYRNNFFAGSVICEVGGKYSVTIDLFIGKNDLIARQFDAAGQVSPDSNGVHITYLTPPREHETASSSPSRSSPSYYPPEQLPGRSPSGASQLQLVVAYDYTLQSIFVNQPFQLPVEFSGGTGPYAVSINWGDGTNDIFSRNDTESFKAAHVYKNSGFYTATITVSDTSGDKASLQFVLLVNGEQDEPSIVRIFSDEDARWWWATLAGLFVSGLIIAFIAGRRIGKNKRRKG